MNPTDRRRSLGLAVLALASTLAPAPLQERATKPDVPALALARGEAGLKAYDMAWLYYTEDRIDADKVYRWSRRLLEAGRDASKDKLGRVAVCRGHVERMGKIVAKIAKIRKLGFGTSLDVVEADFYLKEAEFWLASAEAE